MSKAVDHVLSSNPLLNCVRNSGTRRGRSRAVRVGGIWCWRPPTVSASSMPIYPSPQSIQLGCRPVSYIAVRLLWPRRVPPMAADLSVRPHCAVWQPQLTPRVCFGPGLAWLSRSCKPFAENHSLPPPGPAHVPTTGMRMLHPPRPYLAGTFPQSMHEP